MTLDPSPTYILSVSWSKVRPLVFTATTEDGTTFLYNLGVSTTNHVVEIHSKSKTRNEEDTTSGATKKRKRRPVKRIAAVVVTVESTNVKTKNVKLNMQR